MRRKASNLLCLLTLLLSTAWLLIGSSFGVLAAEPGEVFEKMLRLMQQLPRKEKRDQPYLSDSRSEPLAAPDAHGTARFEVGGLQLGQELSPGSPERNDYECSLSEQFSDFTWCHKKQRIRHEGRPSVVSNSILYSPEGRVSYSNQLHAPVPLTPNAINLELAKRERQFGRKPRILKWPDQDVKWPAQRNQLAGLIAIWGQITLEQLDSDARQILSAGESPRKGLLVDFLSDLTLSAREDFPVYRLGGGAGYMLIASYDKQGAGKLRLMTVDVSALTHVGASVCPFRRLRPADPTHRDHLFRSIVTGVVWG